MVCPPSELFHGVGDITSVYFKDLRLGCKKLNLVVQSTSVCKMPESFSRPKSCLVRKSSSERSSNVPAGFFSVIRTISVDFFIPNQQVVTLNCIGNHTVKQIKYSLLVSFELL